MRKYKRLLAMLLVALVVLTGVWAIFNLGVPQATAETGETAVVNLSWDVVANGGTTMRSGSFVLLSTIGQSATGEASSSSYMLRSGYWIGIVEIFEEILLPIIVQP